MTIRINETKREYNKRKCKQANLRRKKHAFEYMTKTIKKADKDSVINKLDLFKIAKKQKLKCAITGRKLTNENISPDHIVPKKLGGKSIPENIQLVTIEANRAKFMMSQTDFLQFCVDVVKFNNLI